MRDLYTYFDGRVLVDFDPATTLDKSSNYLFALSPHGIMPLTGAWLPSHPDFVKVFGDFDVFMLGATVLNMTPFLRDLAQWAGVRQVTRRTFTSTLQDGKTVLMIPGGVAELTVSDSREKKVNLIYNHKGFVKVALETGTSIIPMFSFGETQYFVRAFLFFFFFVCFALEH